MNNPYSEMIEAMLAASLACEDIPDVLRSSMEYSLMGAGKRLRPTLCLAFCDMLSGNVKNALPVACGIEMIHNYSLIHDDLPCMDDDALRRGRPTNHKVFGEGNAVLAGDGLLTYAFEWMLANAPEEPSDLARYVKAMGCAATGAGVTGMVAGQSLEISHALDEGWTSLAEVQEKKTGALIAAACRAGAAIAGADGPDMLNAAVFGQCFGSIFQLTDDLLDAEKEKDDPKNTVSVYGASTVRTMAEAAAASALCAIERYGEKAGFLGELVKKTLIRTY